MLGLHVLLIVCDVFASGLINMKLLGLEGIRCRRDLLRLNRSDILPCQLLLFMKLSKVDSLYLLLSRRILLNLRLFQRRLLLPFLIILLHLAVIDNRVGITLVSGRKVLKVANLGVFFFLVRLVDYLRFLYVPVLLLHSSHAMMIFLDFTLPVRYFLHPLLLHLALFVGLLLLLPYSVLFLKH
jgi:hypothetical protein